MVRGFKTNRVRPVCELSDSLWEFWPLDGAKAGIKTMTAVPGCWEAIPGFEDYRGEGIYQTTFEASGNVRLTFYGVAHTATVFLDGQLLGNHYNAYTAFSFVQKNLDSGRHVLQIKADNRFHEGSALHVPNDYMSYGGISRPVTLEQLQDIYIDYLHVTPFYKEGQWQAKIETVICSLSDDPQKFDLRIEIADQVCGLTDHWVAPNQRCVFTLETAFSDVQIWDPEHPNLYLAKAELWQSGHAVDDLHERFGFREITVKDDHILLNGKKVRFKGICRHEDHPQFCSALPYAAMQYDIQQIKDLGANAIRCVHYPSDPLFLDLCDEQGLLVWQENHARGLSVEQMQNPNFRHQAMQVTREMVEQHFNHPSICIWGILNECASDDPYGYECYREELSLIKSMDPSRPTSFASCKFKTDLCFGLADIVSYNIYPLWYHDTPVEEYLRDLWNWVQTDTEGKGKPFLITEVGAGGIYGYHNSYDGQWTEDYQAWALDQQLRAILDFSPCQGVFIWQYCDIRISKEWWGGRPKVMNNKGLVDEFRRKKLVYHKAKNIFGAFSSYFD